MTERRSGGAMLIGFAVIVLAVLHQDVWFWDDRTIVFGVLPIGLAYHAGYSITAACLWAIAIKIAWPTHLERWAEGEELRRDG